MVMTQMQYIFRYSLENRGYHGNFRDLNDNSAETFLRAAEYAMKSSSETAAMCALVALDKTPLIRTKIQRL